MSRRNKEYLEEVKSWRAAHKLSSEKCYGYQALTLDLAKNYLEIGEKTNEERGGQSIGPEVAGRDGQDREPLPAGRHQASPATQPQRPPQKKDSRTP